ncbi:hypothetical protein ACHAW5_009598 [Stephanodiscus triporus]|uniref:Anaphase-promoting complex subunit 1 n=1 Tax=Stephanodiscus triporus TaxID=2934178 RepID=A0ABD3MN23_9STRA
MASLKAPLTIVGGNSSRPFQPPAATWFDDDPLHFVALAARPRSSYDGRSTNSSVNTDDGHSEGSTRSPFHLVRGGDNEASNEDTYEIVLYQAFGIPKRNPLNNDVLANVISCMSRPPTSAFDAAKKAAQDNLQALTLEISAWVTLPPELATIETTKMDGSILTEDDEYTCTTESSLALSRRIPILAKFSPKMENGMRFLVMQYTTSMVRVAMVEGKSDEEKPEKSRQRSTLSSFPLMGELPREGDVKNVHWTIDLSVDPFPVTSKPERMPIFKRSSRTLFGTASKDEEGFVPGTTSIIGGGVLWLARGKMQQEEKSFLDLIVVTTTSTLVYNMDMMRGQLVKTQVFAHDLAASFWYEPQTRTLVIGSYKRVLSLNSGITDGGPGDNESQGSCIIQDQEIQQHESSFPSVVMSMKTLFFSKVSPLVDTLPIFDVGTLREVAASEEDKQHELLLTLETLHVDQSEMARQERNSERDVVLPNEISLLNLYGSVYCVELGSMGSVHGGIGLTKLDREAGCIYVRHQKFDAFKGHRAVIDSISVGVIDNLLCIFSKYEETTIFLDVAASFSDDQRVFRGGIELFEPAGDVSDVNVHSKALSFLPPSYFLDTNGQGHIYEVALSLRSMLKSVPLNECIVPFLLRRQMPRTIILTHIMERFSKLISLKDLSSLRNWIVVIAEQYSECEDARNFDFESSVHLLPKSSLLSPSENVDANDIMGHAILPEFSIPVLTQTEILEIVLLPHAMSAVKKGDQNEVKFISSLAIFYFIELEKRLVSACVALQCLVVAVLWRTGQYGELKSLLSAQETQWIITRRKSQLNLPTANQMYFDIPGSTAYAETLVLIATDECSDNVLNPQAQSTARQLISHATIILLGCGATSLAVKCLLAAGRLNDAIVVCLKKIKPNRSAEDIKLAEGTQSKDFFCAAVSNARKMTSISDRCKSFFHLHCFLQQWDPSVLALDSRLQVKVFRHGESDEQRRKISPQATEDIDTVVVPQSLLAHELTCFPDELFGGKASAYCRKLRTMFGFVESY